MLMMLTMMMLMMVVVTMMTMMMATMRTMMVVKMMMLMMMLTLALPERLQLESSWRGDLIFGNCHCFRQLSPCPVHSRY